MLWRYHIFILLLGVPTSRIFSSADPERANGPYGEEEWLDRIVEKLTEESKAVKDTGSQPAISATDTGPPSKKGGSSDAQGLNIESQDPQSSGAKGREYKADAQSPSGTEVEPKRVHAAPGKTAALKQRANQEDDDSRFLSKDDTKFALFVGAGLAAGFIGIMVAGVCYYKFRRSAKAATDINYPAYGVTGPIKEKIPSPGDRKLAQSAQMYHYQHQKQQMIAMEKANGDMKHDASEDESEEDNVEGDYTVYECPGLAPTGEMEVKNPLFCGEEAPPPAGGHAPEQAPPEQGQGRESPSSPNQNHRNH